MSKFHAALFGAVSLLSLSSAAHAQAPAASAVAVDELVVTGRRPIAESAAAALSVQRASDSLVSVLSADTAGNLPDQNIAFAIGRLPGIAVQRDQGQARYINLRGAPTYWTTMSFDGLSIVSPQGRESRFDNIPTALVSQVSVQKAITPNMAGASVAGNVDIRTRRAFDYTGQVITGKLEYGKVELGGGKEIDSNLVYSNVLADGKLGIVAQGSYYTREMVTDNWETDPYITNTTDPDKHFAREHENKHYRLTRENISGSFRADYQFDENNTVFASTIYTQYHDDELRDNFIFRIGEGTNAAGNAYNIAAFISGNDPTFGTSFGARIDARIDYRDSVEEMSTSTLGGEHNWSGWDVSWRANYTVTSDGRDAPVILAFRSPSAFGQRPTVEYDFRNGDVNTVKLFRTLGVTGARVRGEQVTNVEDFAFPITTAGGSKGADITQASTAKVDVSRETQLFDRTTKIQFGGLYTDRQKKSRETTWQTTTFPGTVPTWATFATNLGYQGSQNLNYSFRYTDQDFTTNYVNNLISTGAAPKIDTLPNYYLVGEKLTALYAMATTDLGWGNVVYGARVEQVKNEGQAYVAFPAQGGAPAQTRLVRTSSEDTIVYPSAHLNWNLRQDVKARIGVTTSASRPDFDDLRPNFVINDAAQTVSGGNPEAKPEKQVGIDAYVEWYHGPAGFVSAGVFYKDISDALFRRSSLFGQDALDLPGLDRSGYAYTAVANGGDGYLRGIELAYIGTIETFAQANNWPEWTEGFGVNATATFTDSEINLPSLNGVPARTTTLLGSSDAVYNLQATYEKYGLSMRLAYQYRTPWGESIGDYQNIAGRGIYPVDNGDVFWDADEELDFSARYQINDNLDVFMNGANLTNQGARRYGDKSRYPLEYEKFGRRYSGGVRFKF